jgi:hypothetical protein
MTRRAFVRVLLSLLLVLSQQMAFTHAVSHWSPASTSAKVSKGPAGQQGAVDRLCEQCAAFAQIAGVISSETRSFAPSTPDSTLISTSEPNDACRRTVCMFDSRAPPATA